MFPPQKTVVTLRTFPLMDGRIGLLAQNAVVTRERNPLHVRTIKNNIAIQTVTWAKQKTKTVIATLAANIKWMVTWRQIMTRKLRKLSHVEPSTKLRLGADTNPIKIQLLAPANALETRVKSSVGAPIPRMMRAIPRESMRLAHVYPN